MQDFVLFMQHHSNLSMALVAVVVLLIIVEFLRLKTSSNQLSAALATQLINHQNAAVIDIRNAADFASGHLVDSVSLPFNELESKHKKLEKYKSQPLIIVCATGIESPRAAAILTQQGYNVSILAGGIRAWRTADMPLVKG